MLWLSRREKRDSVRCVISKQFKCFLHIHVWQNYVVDIQHGLFCWQMSYMPSWWKGNLRMAVLGLACPCELPTQALSHLPTQWPHFATYFDWASKSSNHWDQVSRWHLWWLDCAVQYSAGTNLTSSSTSTSTTKVHKTMQNVRLVGSILRRGTVVR